MLRQTCQQQRQSLRETQTLMTILGLNALPFCVDLSDPHLLRISPAFVTGKVQPLQSKYLWKSLPRQEPFEGLLALHVPSARLQ